MSKVSVHMKWAFRLTMGLSVSDKFSYYHVLGIAPRVPVHN